MESELFRKLLLLPWSSDDSLVETNNTDFLKLPEEDDDQFANHQDIKHSVNEEEWIYPCRNEPLKIYSEFDFIKEEFLDSKFQVVDTEKDANVLFFKQPLKRYDLLEKGQYVNQIIGDYVLTARELFSIVVRRDIESESNEVIDAQTLETEPKWCPITFNLSTELINFIAFYNLREERGLDNLWIVKPWHSTWMGGSIVTDNLIQIIRQLDCGRRIVSKYVKDTLTLNIGCDDRSRVKVDFQFVALVPEVSPLKIGILRQIIVRRAEKNYNLNYLEDRTRHMTKTHNSDKMDSESFILAFKQQYPNLNWDQIEKETHRAILKMFKCSTMKNFPSGLKSSQHSKSIYGVDVIFEKFVSNLMKIKR